MFEPAYDGRVHNTLLVVHPDGDHDVARYRKIHLFDAFGSRESAVVAPGDELVQIDVDGVSVGLATCYDVRFADQFSALGRSGAELVLVPASWGDGPGKAEQWDLLTRARAADAQAWLLACDQAWTAPRGRAPLGLGRSVLADPTGAVRARLGSEPGLLVAEIDTDVVRQVRERVPIL
jgi:predicted amidohydrolase